MLLPVGIEHALNAAVQRMTPMRHEAPASVTQKAQHRQRPAVHARRLK
jgi:hypothetical protein